MRRVEVPYGGAGKETITVSRKDKDYNGEYRRRVADDGRWVLERKRPGEPGFKVLHRDKAESKAEAEQTSKLWLDLRREGDAIH